MDLRIGQGYDVHALVPGRPLIIGGVTIPYERGLLGHSDADVLLHAITDALFGAAAHGFAQLTSRAREASPKDWRLPAFALANFAAIGLLAIPFPQLLGNGKGPAGL